MKTTREYDQRARRESTLRTRTAILDAGLALAREKFSVDIVLADVAERAGVTVQTVLRHFSSRERLFDAIHEHGQTLVARQRRAPVGDLETDIAVLVDHYELWGDMSVHLLAQESLDERARTITVAGRAFHRDWVANIVAPLSDRDDDCAIDQLVVVTDVYCWKLLRRDRGLDRATVEKRMLELARAVITSLGTTEKSRPREDQL